MESSNPFRQQPHVIPITPQSSSEIIGSEATHPMRREIRREIHNRDAANYYLPDFWGNLYAEQISTDGPQELAQFHKNEVSVKVTTPKYPILLVEGKLLSVDEDGLYDRMYACGADRRFSVSQFSPLGLELLIEAIEGSSRQLHPMTENGNGVTHFYAYAVFNPAKPMEHQLMGRLLASPKVAPTVKTDLRESVSHYLLSERCLSCDIVKKEYTNYRSKKEHRVLFVTGEQYGDFISFLHFSASDPLSAVIYPFASGHQTDQPLYASRLTDISPQQRKNLADIIYLSVESFRKSAQKVDRNIDTFDISFHSAPFYNINDVARLNGFPRETLQGDILKRSYHFSVKIDPGRITGPHESYPIPGAGQFVVPGRLIEWAELVRTS